MTVEQRSPCSRTRLPTRRCTRPGLIRRMACFTYEGVLLFGVVMIAGYLFSTLTQQRHALTGRHGLQFFLFSCSASISSGSGRVAARRWR